MRGYGILCGLVTAALLAGCGGLSNLSDLNVGSTGSLSQLPEDEFSRDSEEGMPLPVRNALRAGVETASAEKNGGGGLFSLPDLPDLPDVEALAAAAPAEPSSVSQWEENPVGVYTVLARQIHSCWLNPAAPKLDNHGLHAEVAAGNADKATIIVYQKNEEGRRGSQVFRIEIHGEFSGSSVEAKNRKLDKTQDFAFREDIARWSRGDQQCSV
jgi:hypothetical protein